MDYPLYIYKACSILGLVAFAFFVFIFVAGESRDKAHSFLIVLSFVFLSFIPESQAAYGTAKYASDYENAKIITALIHFLICLLFSLSSVLKHDGKAWMHAIVYIFIVAVDVGVVSRLNGSHFALSIFANWRYYELLIIISLIQITISYDSFIAALNRVQDFVSGMRGYINRLVSSVGSHKQNPGVIKKVSRYQDKDDPMYLLEEVE